MSVVQHDVSRRGHELPRLDRVVVPRWLRERRREQARALATEIADEVAARASRTRAMTFKELMRAQGVKPFGAHNVGDDRGRPTAEEWAAFRSALAESRQR